MFFLRRYFRKYPKGAEANEGVSVRQALSAGKEWEK